MNQCHTLRCIWSSENQHQAEKAYLNLPCLKRGQALGRCTVCLQTALPLACVGGSAVLDINSLIPGGLSLPQTAS